MSGLLTKFEVVVEVFPMRKVRMYHFWARTQQQAIDKGNKYGISKSVRKVDATNFLSDIEKLDLKPMAVEKVDDNPYEDAIAMDEMIWRKRNIRIGNQYRDKPSE